MRRSYYYPIVPENAGIMNRILEQKDYFIASSSWPKWFRVSQHIVTAYVIVYFLLVLPGITAAREIEVDVKGVEGELRDNILATLKLYQQRKETDLDGFEIQWLLNEAPKNIEAALEPFGYYSPQITKEVKDTPERLHASYTVDRGLPTHVRKVHIQIQGEANSLGSIQKTVKEFTLREGDILDHTSYKIGKRELLRKSLALGFLEAKYQKSEMRVNRQERWTDINLILDGGPRYLFGKSTSSQEIISSELLERYLHFNEGDPYISRKLIELQRALNRTNYFGRVDIQADQGKAEDLKVPITIDLTEPPFYNRYSVGVGYSTDNGIQGRFEWENRLFNKKGHTVNADLKVSERENRIAGVYKTPIMDPWHDRLVYIGSWEDKEWSDTETTLITAGVNLEHRGDRFSYGVGIDFQKEDYEVGGESDDSTLFIPGGNLSYVTTENAVETRRGLFIGIKVKGSKEGFISDTDFLQGEISGKGIMTFLKNWRLIGRFSLGSTLVDDIDSIPPSLRFYAGGDQSVRGYDYKELGPRDDEGNVVGGRYLVVGSAEIERIIDQSWSVAAFYDMGNAMDDLKVDLKRSVGAGVRYRLPFGQIRVDIATPLSDSDHDFRIHLSVGGDL